jgi:hypothetical protein
MRYCGSALTQQAFRRLRDKREYRNRLRTVAS